MMETKSITTLKGVGPKKADLLKKLRVETVEDLRYLFPRTYQDRSKYKTIAALADGECATVRATVLLVVKDRYMRGKQKLRLLVEDETGRMEIIFFHARYLANAFAIGADCDFYGKAEIAGGKTRMVHPDFTAVQTKTQTGIMPIYPLVSGLSQKDLWKWQREALAQLREAESEYLPEDIIASHNLCSEAYALQNIHFPQDRQRLAEARYRLVFDELFLLQLGLFYIKDGIAAQQNGIPISEEVDTAAYIASFPYTLTGAQQRAIARIAEDMAAVRPMNRLVQGDGGSGKTAIAQVALYKAAKSGFQGVLMAPTEILAKQHYENLTQSYAPFGIKTAFLSGSLTAAERKRVRAEIENGAVDIVIGTHAVIQPDVIFQNLALVITDEQHRFGVKQRMTLAQKGRNPHILVMTATPIPRSLAVILYGDLDISVLDELPPGRQSIQTAVLQPAQREEAYDFIWAGRLILSHR